MMMPPAPRGPGALLRLADATYLGNMRSMRHVFLLAVLGSVLCGCYAYAPVDPHALSPNAPVRAHLTEPRDVSLPDRTLHGIVRVDGELVRAEPASIILAGYAFQTARGQERIGMGQTVVLPVTGIALVEGRRFAPARTAGFVVLGGVILLLIDRAIAELGGGRDGSDGGGAPVPR
jgi:hypothetical protein